MMYLVLVLLINSICHLFLPWGTCIHLHSMQDLTFVIAQCVNGGWRQSLQSASLRELLGINARSRGC